MKTLLIKSVLRELYRDKYVLYRAVYDYDSQQWLYQVVRVSRKEKPGYVLAQLIGTRNMFS